MQKVDFLIVGQGLAGSILAYQLIQKGKTVLLIDEGSGNTASRQATGLINPITGRRFVKTWLIDELFPFAQNFYTKINREFGIKCFQQTAVWKVLQNPEQTNDFHIRLKEEAYQAYLQEELTHPAKTFTAPYGCAVIEPVLQIDINVLQDGFSNYFKQHACLKNEDFRHEELQILEGQFQYGDIQAQQLIFAEGYKIKDNPYFNYLPYTHSKGEALVIKSKELQLDKVLNSKITFTPLGEDTYYVGATYDWSDNKQKPTLAKRAYILAGIEASTDANFEILEQKVGIRPTVKDRRPLIGEHPAHKGMYIFNGMGTKGLSLGPYFAKELINHILDKKAIHPEVDIKRVK